MGEQDVRLWQPPMTTDADLAAEHVVVLENTLTQAAHRFRRVALACSLQAEDLVLLDAVARLNLPIRPFVLDTLRLHDETLAYLDLVSRHYGLAIERVAPDPGAVVEFERAQGRFSFYDGTDQRHACCGLRKVQPLAIALSGADAWMTGQRRSQGETRTALAEEEPDVRHAMVKLNPLAAWSEAAVWQYLRTREVPVHPLYARGFASIGCEPCTRAIRAGEAVRAGRWWWEDAAGKECGLHVADVAEAAA